jgi:UDPglucose 6-dehydrogenase
MLNCWVSPIDDAETENNLQNKLKKFHATFDPQDAYGGADFVIIATPPTTIPKQLLQYVLGRGSDLCRDGDQSAGDDAHQFTMPVDYTARTREAIGIPNLIFSPKFLHEGRAH